MSRSGPIGLSQSISYYTSERNDIDLTHSRPDKSDKKKYKYLFLKRLTKKQQL